MNETNLMDYIPPETLIGFFVTAIGLFFAALGGVGYLFRRWFLSRLETERERTKQEIDAAKAKQELDRMEAEAKQRQRDMEVQRQLDETHTGRETMLRWFDALSEERKDNAEQRKEAAKLLETQVQSYAKIADTIGSLDRTTAALFSLLKENQESGESMAIGQRNIVSQNEESHRKMVDISNDLAAIAIKLETITVGRASDRKIIDEIHEQVLSVKQSLSAIEALGKAAPVTVAIATHDTTPVTEAKAEDKPA